jgi:alkyldihydroxyacetonephosphate synthase
MEEMAKQRLYPTSLRLVDNEQFMFGQALKPTEPSSWKALLAKIAKYYITNVKGFKPDEICAATCLFEGDKVTCDM